MHLRYFLLGLGLIFATSCSDAPKNHSTAKVSIYNITDKDADVDQQKKASKAGEGSQLDNFNNGLKLTPEVFEKPGDAGGEVSEEEQKLKLANLRKPIVYGVGASGITMDTSYEDSKTLLTPPWRGPFSDGLTFYNEQVVVIWSDQGERKPRMIVPLKDYEGSMEVGKFGKINFQTKFPTYKSDGQAGAQRLTLELYAEFEQSSDGYNCLATGRCRLIYGTVNQANFVMVFPGAVMLMAKEEFQVAEIRIIRDVDAGLLSSNLELSTGDITPEGEGAFSLGQTYKDIFDRINASDVKSSPEVYVQTSSIGYSWNGIWYSFHRSDFANTVAKPSDGDKLTLVQISPEFPAAVTFDNKRVLVTQSKGSVSFALETAPDPVNKDKDNVVISPTEVESKLKMSIKIPKDNAQEFVEKFGAFLKTELSKKYDKVYTRVSGDKDEKKKLKEIAQTIVAVNKADNKGVFVGFRVSQEQERLDYVIVGQMDPETSPYDHLLTPASFARGKIKKKKVDVPVLNAITGEPVMDPATGRPLTKKQIVSAFDELQGVQLNDMVRLKEVDSLGRGEATVEMVSLGGTLAKKLKIDLTKTPMSERSVYNEQGSYTVFDAPNDRPIPRFQGVVSVGNQAATLGISNIGPDANGDMLARVVSITTGQFYRKVSGICGLKNFDLTIGMKDKKVISKLKAAASNASCKYFNVLSGDQKGNVVQVFFPDDRLKLNFSDRALSSISIYLPLSEVNKSTEVK